MKTAFFSLILSLTILLIGCNPIQKKSDSHKESYLSAEAEYETNGYLTQKSVENLRKAHMEIKAISAYEFALPIVGIQQWHLGFLEDGEHGDWVFFDNIAQKLPILTANQSTPYTVTYVDLSVSPYYIEIPSGRIGGLILDIYQRPQADLGMLGPDAGKGGKYLLVGPGQEVPEGHDADWVINSNCNLVFAGTRIIGADKETTDKLRRQHFVYKVGELKEGQKFIPATETPKWLGAQSTGLQYWIDVYDVLKNEPVEGINRIILTQLRDLGITKSGGFNPDNEQKEILTQAAIKGDAIAMVHTFSKKSYKSKHWPDRNWRYILNQTKLDLMHDDYYEAKEMASFSYEAITTSKAMVMPIRNDGSKYLGVYVDENEEWLDGENTYEITIPANAPAKDFWSIAVYNNKTRALIDNKEGNAVINNKGDIKVEADGSVKIYIAPKAPKGYENNWVQSNVDEGFFLYFRLYGPTEAYYDKSWKMSDVKKVN
ncbi:MAG: DUF1254 domain-containing protein [Bacteroidales bacterium]|nr:DUF1254 domain-containing protein [Bacteroidales bacterium]